MQSPSIRKRRWFVLGLPCAVILLGAACGNGNTESGGSGGSSTGGVSASGGLGGGSPSTSGGTRSTGGVSSSGGAGKGGALGSGGAASGGSTSSVGGANTGGVSNGGTAGGAGRAGGAAGGGTNNGGAAGGGTNNGGAAGGGTNNGGAAGGTNNGGAAGGGTNNGGAGGRGTGTGGAGGVGAGGATSGTGGSSAAGGTTGASGPQAIVKDMGVGWNLGNTFDATPNETSWGNPPTTQAMIQAVKAAGFKTMRVPVTWTGHIGAAPSYTIDATWMGKVEQVVKWVLDAGMYAILNTHHDADEGGWCILSASAQAQVTAEVTALWKQIATRFKDNGDHLIFETFNEPHGSVNAYNGGNAEQQTALNAYIAAAVSAIRGTGGNNAQRAIMIQPHGASPAEAGIKALAIPNDPNLLISIHTYYPTGFSFGPTPTTWGSASDYSAMGPSLDQIQGWLPNRAIVIGEWGTVSGAQLDSRVKHAKAYVQDVIRRGMCPVWWDNGGTDFGILDRKANPPSWIYPTIVSALMSGATAGAAPGAGDAKP